MWRLKFDEWSHDKGYGALELMGIAKPFSIDFATLLFYWIRNPSKVPAQVTAIAESIAVREGLIVYRYRQDLARALASVLPQPPALIPEGWRFAWGGRQEITLLLNALSLRCLYHILAVHFGASLEKLRGMGNSNLILVISHDVLISDIELLSSVHPRSIKLFVDSLVYGRGTETPDPALQPLIPLGAGQIAIPCIHVLSSNQERNLLSLMARTEPQAFHAQSELFEKDMVTALSAAERPRGVVLCANRRFRFQGVDEEVDLLLIDPEQHRILVAELRWMLPPGDPREVQNRKQECLKKVDQLRRKIEKLSPWKGRVVSSALSLAEEPLAQDWSVSGIVLVSGYAGTRSSSPSYPILPVNLFVRALGQASSLTALATWCQSLHWLPQEGKDFSIMTMSMELPHAQRLEVPGMDILSVTGYTVGAVAGM